MKTVDTAPRHRGDEAELYRRHHGALLRAVSRTVCAPPELIEDACQTAWVILLRRQPDRDAIFAWLRVVAIHEAYRLSRADHRQARLEDLARTAQAHPGHAEPAELDDAISAREALSLVAALPPRQRDDLWLLIAGYSYREIALHTGPRTYTNVSKHLARARARIRAARSDGRGAPAGLASKLPSPASAERSTETVTRFMAPA
jgi:RNA polymerase sigma factor (sigma-70 family)